MLFIFLEKLVFSIYIVILFLSGWVATSNVATFILWSLCGWWATWKHLSSFIFLSLCVHFGCYIWVIVYIICTFFFSLCGVYAKESLGPLCRCALRMCVLLLWLSLIVVDPNIYIWFIAMSCIFLWRALVFFFWGVLVVRIV